VAEAGWQPVTAATCAPAEILLERFGPDTNGTLLFTVFNPTTNTQAVTVLPQAELGIQPANAIATELLSAQRLTLTNGGWSLNLNPESAAVLQLQAGPRFTRIRLVSAQVVGLAIASPAGVELVLQSSGDLVSWTPILTNAPQAAPYAREEWVPAGSAKQFFRLRWQ
jgi:hypothetical protein